MPVTRRQAALKQGKKKDKSEGTTQTKVEENDEVQVGDKRQVGNANELEGEVEPPMKKNKAEEDEEDDKPTVSLIRHTGTIERGHIYFFYRPRVEMEEAHSIDDVQRLHMLLVPRPPKFSVLDGEKPKLDRDDAEDDDMAVLQEGADAVPAKATLDTFEKHYRLITIGKKALPHPEVTSRRERVFWAAVTAVGDDLHSLEKGLRAKSYETKTRGTRHKEASRLAARGVYAIVNNEPSVPSKAATHLGFFISHPEKMGEVQEALGIQKASSFVLQVKNPLAPNTGGVRTPSSKQVNYPESIMKSVFGQGTKGRESYGLRFVDCQTIELLEYEGAELLLIASRSGEEGVETSLGGGRGEALEQLEESEASESIGEIFRELALDQDEFPQDALKGEWI
ncbi:hypothetical protein PC9H_003405 [Pleurotus ostreatus]|uniref:Uncharacterized protein n=2 Tax=Pleurotus TaxID=5320 RepID=A0A8H7A0X4_PLEOS|nr:uncharacterized protein PC9H_003405 [Pleurotus ostreatus]KAF7436572.1 hypothetical protein PC9H_003405 [Pleurotus ostreatus]KAG9222576.1 hypothetical protein CCMSSC00406_0002911 [Pleurotus cornucopiae]